MTKKCFEKLQMKKKIKLFGSKTTKTTIYLSLGLHKKRRSLQLSKEAIQNFKT
jgi:hypothetical protein